MTTQTQPQTVTIWTRLIASATVTLPDGTKEEHAWPEGRNGNVPVCNGGALSVETWETASSSFLSSIIYAPGTWSRVAVTSELRKIEIANPQQGAAH